MAGEDLGQSRFADPDHAYRMLVEAHRGLSDEDSNDLNARLVLVLANRIGDPQVLRAAVALAKGEGERAPS